VTETPVADNERIESLDVLRGFALLGILLLNIVGFGLQASAYSNPGSVMTSTLDMAVWAGIDLFAEGAMRCLFSILFGAGVVLFTQAKGSALHYRRNFWLLCFGLFDAYVLLWNADILVNYALAGAVLYWVKDVRAGRLLVAAGAIVLLMSAFHVSMQFGLGLAEEAAEAVAQSEEPQALGEDVRAAALIWEDFAADYLTEDEQVAEELHTRRDSYLSAFLWNVKKSNEMLFYVLPLILFWDALAMMLLGMGLYKLGVLQGQRSTQFYTKLMLCGFAVGLAVNAYEVNKAISNDFELLSTFAQAQVTYHFGRLGMALGYIGLLVLILHKGLFGSLRARLASVGRMALTNYLMHSIICIFVFTGAGFALVGELARWQLYVVVLAIWLLQLLLSPWWLQRYKFGPVEWLWRGLTYGKWPPFRREK
jgi:uncharacterized protein